jgi:6-pyruvoyltetrahydropterin/6-carboxytetrahydropterin synthase
MELSATKRFEFSYAHFLPGYQGACAQMHGHNAILEVTVTGQDPTYKSMVMDFSTLKHLVNEHVMDRMDHQLLNNIQGLERPTAENMAWMIWGLLEDVLPQGVALNKIRLSETEGSWVTLEL